MNQLRLSELVRPLTIAFNAMLLLQLVLIASANPSWPLVAAVLCECGFFLAINGYRVWRDKTSASKAESAALERIENKFKLLLHCRRGMTLVLVSGLYYSCVYMTIDSLALSLCRVGATSVGERIYETANVRVPGLDPAFSLELLTGAFIERGNFEKAEPLELALLRIRARLFGDKTDMTASMYSNMGDFYGKWKKPVEAENYYRRAIALTKQLGLKQGWGSPATKLATLLRKQGRRQEAEKMYLEALNIRTKIFGQNSAKVAETLTAYAGLLTEENRKAESAKVRSRIDSINALACVPSRDDPSCLMAVLVIALSSIFMWQRGRLLIYCSKILEQHV